MFAVAGPDSCMVGIGGFPAGRSEVKGRMKKLRSKIRSVVALVGAVLVGWYLNGIGWPWWAWLPATILGAMTIYMAFVLTWFAWRKLTYEAIARRMKRRNRAEAASSED
jgi:fatty acid desaturase